MKGWVEVGKKKSEIRKSRLSLTEIIIRLFLCPPILIVAPFFFRPEVCGISVCPFSKQGLACSPGKFQGTSRLVRICCIVSFKSYR